VIRLRQCDDVLGGARQGYAALAADNPPLNIKEILRPAHLRCVRAKRLNALLKEFRATPQSHGHVVMTRTAGIRACDRGRLEQIVGD